MKIGLLTVLFQDKSLKKALDIAVDLGIQAVELGTGGYVGDAHCNPETLLGDQDALRRFQELFRQRDLSISALSCHGNPLHPKEEIARPHHDAFRRTVRLAQRLEVDRVITFSGCPGGSQTDATPNWVTCPWPGFDEMVQWQWEARLIPYWRDQVVWAREHGVKVCLEMHPGFCVYNPETLRRLRNEVGEVVGANFDPSHLFWQGIDPMAALFALDDSIYHVHMKDTKVNRLTAAVNGVLDTKPYSRERERSWVFRTVGYGHGYDFWKEFVSALRMIGYDDVLSIEHEDSLMSARDGLEKAVTFLKQVVLGERPGQMWWA